MAKVEGYQPVQGARTPEKYPFVGSNYNLYGEQPGFIYDPYKDQYYADRRTEAQKRQEEEAAKGPKSLAETVLPIAGIAGAAYLGKEVAGEIIPGIKKGASAITGMLDSGPAAPSLGGGPTQSTTPTAFGATPTQSSAPTGMLDAPEVVSATRVPGASAPAPMSIAPGAAVPEGFTAVGTNADGSTLAVPAESVGADGSVDLGGIAQGAAGAYQLYQGYNDYKKGNYLGAGINTAGGAAMIGSALGNQTAASAMPILGPVAGVYGAYQTDKMVGSMPAGGRRNTNATMSGAAAGAALGSAIPGVGTAIGAGVGALAGFALSQFGSSKDKYQMIRDGARENLQKNGILDENWQGTLADGTTFDFGKDGKGQTKLDYSDPTTGRVIGLANVISAGEGMFGRGTDALSMLYSGAALSNAGGDYEKARQNMLHFAKQRGFTPENVSAQLQKMKDEGQIDEGQYQAYLNGVNELFQGGAPAGNQPTGMMDPPRSSTSSPGMKNGNVIQLDPSGGYIDPNKKPVPMTRGGGMFE